MLSTAEKKRVRVSNQTEAKRKAELGQFLTPVRTARFMASLFTTTSLATCYLLDPGAGIGSLSSAFLERWIKGDFIFNALELEVFEIDRYLYDELNRSLSLYTAQSHLSYKIQGGDFIEEAVKRIQSGDCPFTHVILNPPYKKIGSTSHHRLQLRSVGIETVNLYSAFIALSLKLMAPGGQLVAIVPRSFCNGPYYRSFRNFILEHAVIQNIHLFESRTKIFQDNDVLQENIIIKLERSGKQGSVIISKSNDGGFNDLLVDEYPFDRIVSPEDSQQFIYIPNSIERSTIEQSVKVCYSLSDLGIQVSTGPVVDFRLKPYLCDLPQSNTVPLLYPAHFSQNGTEWPKNGKKPNAIQRNSNTEKWLYPNGYYCVVRRFSSKEEKRRIIATVVDPTSFGDAEMLGFENHLNLFHDHKQGLNPFLAYGLTLFLNTTALDENFRQFNGHTQVNATDLKQMKYPSRTVLMELGQWAMRRGVLTQKMIDEKVGAAIA